TSSLSGLVAHRDLPGLPRAAISRRRRARRDRSGVVRPARNVAVGIVLPRLQPHDGRPRREPVPQPDASHHRERPAQRLWRALRRVAGRDPAGRRDAQTRIDVLGPRSRFWRGPRLMAAVTDSVRDWRRFAALWVPQTLALTGR